MIDWKGKTVFFSGKLRLAKAGAIKTALKQKGVAKFPPHAGEVMVLGSDFKLNDKRPSDVTFVFERELLDQLDLPRSEVGSMQPLLDEYHAMLRTLLATPGVSLDLVEAGKPATQRDFAWAEKKLGHALPEDLRAFYSVFGSLTLVWSYAVTRGDRDATWGWEPTRRAADGQHCVADGFDGSIRILPLRKLIGVDWHEDRHWEDPAADDSRSRRVQAKLGLAGPYVLRVFDYWSEDSMAALHIEPERVVVHHASENAASIDVTSFDSLPSYLSMVFRAFGLVELRSKLAAEGIPIPAVDLAAEEYALR